MSFLNGWELQAVLDIHRLDIRHLSFFLVATEFRYPSPRNCVHLERVTDTENYSFLNLFSIHAIFEQPIASRTACILSSISTFTISIVK